LLAVIAFAVYLYEIPVDIIPPICAGIATVVLVF
jgi:hypothetical protein